MTRMHASEVPNPLHREASYQRHGVLERLSVVQRRADGSLLAVNLYRHCHQGRFSPEEVACFANLAPLLLAAVLRHITLAPLLRDVLAVASATGLPARIAGQLPSHLPSHLPGAAATGPRATLQAHCPALTGRELDICERLLRGWTYDGIAADLGLSIATVKTYRARAFDRLGMHCKSELFAAFMPLH